MNIHETKTTTTKTTTTMTTMMKKKRRRFTRVDGGYFRQDHPIVKRAEIYTEEERREESESKGREGEKERGRASIKSARRYRDSTLSRGHRAELTNE